MSKNTKDILYIICLIFGGILAFFAPWIFLGKPGYF